MTYCLGITTTEGLVLASDSRTNAGFDQVNVTRKMFRFVQPGERIFVFLTSGSLSISQSVITLLRDAFDSGRGLAQASSLYDAARIVGDCVRRVSDIDRASLERDSFSFNVHLLLGGQVRGQAPNLYLIYPQGNPLAATEDSLYLQLGSVNMAARFWIVASRLVRLWRSRRNTRCCRWTQRCAQTLRSVLPSTCFYTRKIAWK